MTFLLRAPKLRISALNLNQVAQQYGDVFNIDEKSAREMARFTKGYAFAFQALGMVAWENGLSDDNDRIIRQFDNILDDSVYKKIWEGLTSVEKKIVLSISDDDIMTAKGIQEVSGVKSESYSHYRESLINKGVLISPEYGKVAFALPRFNSIVKTYVV